LPLVAIGHLLLTDSADAVDAVYAIRVRSLGLLVMLHATLEAVFADSSPTASSGSRPVRVPS
jgi:hypothetical protein